MLRSCLTAVPLYQEAARRRRSGDRPCPPFLKGVPDAGGRGIMGTGKPRIYFFTLLTKPFFLAGGGAFFAISRQSSRLSDAGSVPFGIL